MEPLSSTSEAAPLQIRLAALGRVLQENLQALVAELPVEAQRTSGLSVYCEVNKVFASRLLTALRQADPIAVLHRLPGPEPLRRFLLSPNIAKLPATRCSQQAPRSIVSRP